MSLFRIYMLSLMLGGIASLVLQVSMSTRTVHCVKTGSAATDMTCTEHQTGPLVLLANQEKVFSHIGDSVPVLTQLEGSRGTSMLWTLLLVPRDAARATTYRSHDGHLRLAQAHRRSTMEADQRRFQTFRTAPAGATIQFADHWRWWMGWLMRLAALGLLAAGGLEVRRVNRNHGSNPILAWTGSAIAALLGSGIVLIGLAML